LLRYIKIFPTLYHNDDRNTKSRVSRVEEWRGCPAAVHISQATGTLGLVVKDECLVDFRSFLAFS